MAKNESSSQNKVGEHTHSQPHAHAHAHAHAHSHAHHHHSHGLILGRMKLAFYLNIGFAIIELVGGILTNSVAILSDALHDFGDAIAVVLAILAEKISHRKSDQEFSYGYRRFSTLGAVITGLILLFGSIFILIQAVPRLLVPLQPNTDGMLILALLGVAVNGFAAYEVSKGTSLNERMIMWHLFEDVMGWVLVLLGAIVMKIFDVPQVDAGLAIVLSLWIIYNVIGNLHEAMKVFLMASPNGIALDHIKEKILTLDLVESIHHAHLWSLDGENHILTVHVVLNEGSGIGDMTKVKEKIKSLVRDFGIIEATIETELVGATCSDPEHK